MLFRSHLSTVGHEVGHGLVGVDGDRVREHLRLILVYAIRDSFSRSLKSLLEVVAECSEVVKISGLRLVGHGVWADRREGRTGLGWQFRRLPLIRWSVVPSSGLENAEQNHPIRLFPTNYLAINLVQLNSSKLFLLLVVI